MTPRLAALCAAAAFGLAPAMGLAQSPSPAVVSSCANPALPSSILGGDGVPDKSAREAGLAPLALTDVAGSQVHLALAVADEEDARELGLMCVLHLKPQHGMIFVFDGGDRRQEFWMKDTLIALDMIWVRADGTIDTVAANVPASTLKTPDADVARRAGTGKYVIELAAGEAAKDGLAAGGHLKIAKLL
jgi:uncharacterized membrane protein (UPF0127 family)